MLRYAERVHASGRFSPGIDGLLTNPFYLARRGLHEQLKELAPLLGGCILDVGCGEKPYRGLFTAATSYVGLEIDRSDSARLRRDSADCYYDGTRFPFDDEVFDAVIMSQVLEHVFAPDPFLREAHRVLRTDGRLLITVPFVWDEHEQPWDYARYSSYGLRHLLHMGGFSVLEQRKSLPGPALILQLVNLLIYERVVVMPHGRGWLAAAMPAMAAVNAAGWATSHGGAKQDAQLYLDNVVLARKDDT